MKRNLIFLLIILVILIAGVAAWGMAPRVVGVSPTSDNEPLLGKQPLQIVFSRPMNAESVEAHLSSQPPQTGTIFWNQSHDSLTFTPNQPWPHGETFTLRLDSGTKSKLGLPLLQSYTWNFEITSPVLVYLWPADGNSNLYTLNLETGESQTLTAYPNGVLDFDVSGDGLTLYYSVWHSSEESALYALSRLTGESSLILECVQSLCRSPKISPDGKYLAYEWIPQVADGVPGVRVYDLENHRSIAVGESRHFTENPIWSSTGWLAYYDHTLQAFVFTNLADGKTITLANETGGSGSWSPMGDAFITTEILQLEVNHAPRHLLKFSLNTETKQDFTLKNYLEDANPVYSPDGDFIAFERKCLEASCWSPGRQLWIMSSSGNRAYVLTDAPDYNHTGIVWHQDGQRLAYVRYNNAQISEPPEIWFVNRSGAQKTRLVINGYAPRWLP
ncbi:MAG: Ig-like domain-containing protein [Chloroflexota bacterium]|nr:Ig-like domain-containing protein [Chloroflexota bacterium]